MARPNMFLSGCFPPVSKYGVLLLCGPLRNSFITLQKLQEKLAQDKSWSGNDVALSPAASGSNSQPQIMTPRAPRDCLSPPTAAHTHSSSGGHFPLSPPPPSSPSGRCQLDATAIQNLSQTRVSKPHPVACLGCRTTRTINVLHGFQAGP